MDFSVVSQDSTTNLLTSQTDALGRTTAFQYAKGNKTQMTLLSGTGNAVS